MTTAPPRSRSGQGVLVLGALGVVFGDIGTSPLDAMEAVFAGGRVPASGPQVYGVVSLIVWALTLVVSPKDVTFVMRRQRRRGGVMARIAGVRASRLPGRRTRAGIVAAGLLGVSLFLGDGMITPAISVLSAVEGVEIAAPAVRSAVLPIGRPTLMPSSPEPSTKLLWMRLSFTLPWPLTRRCGSGARSRPAGVADDVSGPKAGSDAPSGLQCEA